MSMKLNPAMSPAGLSFREYNSCFSHLTNSRPQQSKLPLTPSTPREKITEEKNHRVNLPPHQLQKMEGGGGRHPTTWAGCNTHRTATRPHGTAASAPMPAEDTASGWVGTEAPRTGLTPKDTPRREVRRPKNTPSLKGRSCIVPR